MEIQKLTILSTFAQDKIINKESNLIYRQKGGPAFYFINIFKKESVSFNPILGSKVKVEILVAKGSEFGRVREIPKTKKINFEKIKTPFLLISTIYKEFNLSGISKFQGKIFLDIQGYVRDIKKFGKKQQWRPKNEIISSIFCLKGTEEEIKYIPYNFLKEQKQKILIITKGKSGCDVLAFGKKYEIKIKKPINTEDALGAGDTFFAFVVSKFLKTNNILKSVRYAVDKTSEFLTQKLK